MKLFEIPMVMASLVGLCLLSGADTPAAHANFTFGPPVNLGPTINSESEVGHSFSADGLELYFSRSESPAPHIYVSRRATPDSEWSVPIYVGPPIDSHSGYSSSPSLSADGLSLYYDCYVTGERLHVAKRATTHDDWGPPVSVSEAVNVEHACTPCISADELELYFMSRRYGGYGDADLWVITRATVNDAWGVPVNLGPTINTPFADYWPGISPDGLLLFFGSSRPGGSGGMEVYVARRATRKDPWGPPTNVGPVINSAFDEGGAKVAFDGSMLYFFSSRSGGYGGADIWQAPILPAVDFNGDGRVDAKDMAILVDDLGKNQSPCDIGPFPWGDGIVDERDLRVLMESVMTPGPKASDVPCDVTLSWTSPSFAQTCDVYFGTSQEAVSSAGRTDPRAVLVSQGQIATTYKPAGLLEYGRAYYWRVDFVVAGPVPTIYRGSVLDFTTEPFARPIKNITATGSSASPGCGPERTVDGSGLDKSDGHSTDQKDMWCSLNKSPSWIQYEFDKIYTLHKLWVWNFNTMADPFIGFGAKTVRIEYSTDSTTWTSLADVPEFARAPGKPGYTPNTIVRFAGVPAKFVKLTIEKNWGGIPQTGLSEVRFFCIRDRSVIQP